MSRGFFKSIKNNDIYKESDKEWKVELQTYHKYWYDLVVNPKEVAEYFDTRKLIVDYLKEVKKSVEENLEKRFVYFICSRIKVRFNVKKRPSYNPITKKTKIHILIGKEERPDTIRCKFFNVTLNKFSNPKIDLTDKYITLTDESGNSTTSSIHDFLDKSNIDLGISSNVEYVGYTENPHTRPTNGSHTGLSDIFCKVSNENNDILIYFNLFKVTTKAVNNESLLDFIVPNAMTDEIGVELEGNIIEKSFIFYFDSINQNRNKDSELSELKNNLIKINNNNKIKSIFFYYEFKNLNDYGCFSSSKVKSSHSHRFEVSVKNGSVEIIRDTEQLAHKNHYSCNTCGTDQLRPNRRQPTLKQP
ncbi:MAG: hypothetical protein RL571_769 [Pseudomonadota bacterium]